MGDPVPLPNDTLSIILSYLEEAGSYVLASPEEADYFRKGAKKAKKEEKEIGLGLEIPKAVPPTKEIGLGLGHGLGLEIPKALPPIVPATAPKSVPVPLNVSESVSVSESVPPPFPSSPQNSIRNILSSIAPELAILNEIPSDAIAKKISERWKTKNQSAPISILLFQEPAEQKALLEQIAKALDVCFGPAKIVQAETIEKEKQWEAFLSVADLKMVLVCDYTLWQLNGLLGFYKETPAQGVRTLGNVPLFLLPDLSLYLKDPLLKRSLWKALCQKFS